MDCEIRLAELADVKELAKVKKDIWESNLRGVYNDEVIDNFDYEKEEKTFINIINNEDVDLYSVLVDEKIVGYMDCGKPYNSFQDYEAEIGLLYLKKECQGQGIGTMLFQLAKESFRNKGLDKFFISCNKYNLEAQKFYEAMGGKVVHVDEDNFNDKRSVQIKYHYDI